MDYRRFENTIVVRLNRGEEILTELKKICEAENVKLARLYALGATDHFVVGAYSVEEQKYYKNEFNGTFEITNLTGNITTMNGEYYAHLHITCADEKSKCLGGHLNECRISATLEMFIEVLDGTVERMKDEASGLNVFKF